MDLSNERLSSFCLISPPGRPSASADGFKQYRLSEGLELHLKELLKTPIDHDPIFTRGKFYNKSTSKHRFKRAVLASSLILKEKKKKKT